MNYIIIIILIFITSQQSFAVIGIVESNQTIQRSVVGVLDQNKKIICTGVLINTEMILTAGHCQLTKGYISTLELSTESRKMVPFLKRNTVRHEKYEYLNSEFDLMIIKLDSLLPSYMNSMNISDRISLRNPLHFSGVGTGFSKNEFSSIINVKDKIKNEWSYLSQFAPKYPFLRLPVLRTIKSDSVRSQKKSTYFVSSKGEGICKGDSGGVLYDDNFNIVGIASSIGVKRIPEMSRLGTRCSRDVYFVPHKSILSFVKKTLRDRT